MEMDLERLSSYKQYDNSDDDAEEFTDEEKANDPAKRILWAAENNLIDVVNEILALDPSLVKSTDGDLYTPLHRASYNNHLEMSKLLLEHGANISAQTSDGWQPLHSAARWNSVQVAQLLIGGGADVNAATHGGLTPLHLAASEPGSGAVLELLLAQPAVDVNCRSQSGETARQLCIRHSPHLTLFDVKDNAICCLRPNTIVV